MSKREAPADSDIPSAKKSKMAPTDVPMGGDGHIHIDEDLHSRQLAVYGREVMRKVAASSVLISGMNGLGVEIAKNVILAGVRGVTAHDKKAVDLVDLSAQFYLTEKDLGKNRAEACKEKLQELNSGVKVASSTVDLTEDVLKQFTVVVCTTASLADAQRIDQICHANDIRFIWAQTAGVFARVFTDFGPNFTVIDVNGEEPHQGIVAAITGNGTSAPCIVNCVEDERLEFQDGELVTFSEVGGMEQLNQHEPIRVKNCKPHSFELELDASAYGTYARGGIVVQVKEHKTLAFKPLAQSLAEPGEFMLSDYAKFDRPALLHLGFKALDAFEAEAGRKPKPADAADANRLLELAKSINEAQPADAKIDVTDDILRLLAHNSSAEVCPMAAMFGGVVGQEVLKAVSGKFHPVHQWFYFDSVESLPNDLLALPAAEFAPAGTRYDPQIAVFGRSLQAKLASLNLFLVGAGALGCEFIKNFAMMGIACGDAAKAAGASGTGKITITDDDVIEKSNLSRQFLFRDWNIGGSKSTVAGDAARGLNPSLNVNPLQNRVSPETEGVFNDAFWEGLDLVVNALDNVNARLYVDTRCVYFGKPLLESGTLGPKCNTQMVIPKLTENYGASRDPPEKQAPMCTVHSFPHNIDHCLTWARSEFEGLLEKGPSEANTFLADPDKYVAGVRANPDASARQKLEGIAELLVDGKVSTFEDCVAWARKRFQDYFHDRVLQLTFTFPEDAMTSTGSPFWSAPKRFPRPLVFSADDASHASFVQAAAILKAQVHNVALPAHAKDTGAVAKQAAAVAMTPFEPKKGIKIETDPKKQEAAASGHDDEHVIEDLLGKLSAATSPAKPGLLAPVQFEKDDDTNYHMDVITGLANMRARCYSVPEVDKLKAKLIAGRIIPAIATATAVATGLVCLDLYKAVQNKPIEAFRNTFANLALPLFAMAEPVPAKTITYKDISFSLWDRWILEGDLTVQEVLDWFSEKGLTAYSISCGSALLYNNIFPKHVSRLPQKLSELVGTVAKLEIPAERNHFDIVVACEDENDEDIDVPLVSIKFRG